MILHSYTRTHRGTHTHAGRESRKKMVNLMHSGKCLEMISIAFLWCLNSSNQGDSTMIVRLHLQGSFISILPWRWFLHDSMPISFLASMLSRRCAEPLQLLMLHAVCHKLHLTLHFIQCVRRLSSSGTPPPVTTHRHPHAYIRWVIDMTQAKWRLHKFDTVRSCNRNVLFVFMAWPGLLLSTFTDT